MTAPTTRLPFRLTILLLGGGVLGSLALAAAPNHPNIIWIVSEDNSAYTVGAYGDPLARTPVLDRMAEQGIVFDHCYATAPVCAAARASIITGRYAPSLGTQHMRSYVTLPDDLKYFPTYLREAGYFTTNCAKTDYNAVIQPGAWDENGPEADWRHRQPGQPFFSVINIFGSHESSLHRRLPLVTDPAQVRVPAYLPDTPTVRADFAQHYDRVAAVDWEIGEVLARLQADGLADDTIVFYYSDHGGVLPRSKRFLYENGLHVPFIAYFPPKYRALAPPAEDGRNAELVNFVDLAPTVLSLAGLTPPGGMQGRAIAGAARAAAPAYTYGFRDRMDERYDLGRTVTDGRWRYIRNYLPHLPDGQHLGYLWRMASMAEWDRLYRAGKLNAMQSAFFEPKAPEMLFDLEADPDNVRNLASDPAHREVLERFRAANRAHLLATRDLGFLPEGMMHALAGERSPTLVAADESAYPLERLLELIDQLQLGVAPDVDALAAALHDPLAVVRYWGAIGAIRGAMGQEMVLNQLLADPELSVRLAAATAILHHGDSMAAWKSVAVCLAPPQPGEVRLAALNFITQRSGWPEWLRPLIAASGNGLGRNGENYVWEASNYLRGREDS